MSATGMFTDRMSISQGADRLNLSTRVVYRILRMPRTVADLEKVAVIGEHHLLEAVVEVPTDWCGCRWREYWSVCLLIGVSVRCGGCRWREFW